MGKFWIGLLLSSLTSFSSASIVTEQFSFALSSAAGIYDAGHVFTVTTTYDNASTMMHIWNDGANGQANFGGDDDTLNRTFSLSDPSYVNSTLFADATISISGLLQPSGATPRDVYTSNESLTYEYLDSVTDGEFVVQLLQDDLYFAFELFGPSIPHPYAGQLFLQLNQYFFDSANNPQQIGIQQLISASSVQRIEVTPISEPATNLLLALGIFSLLFTDRKARQINTF